MAEDKSPTTENKNDVKTPAPTGNPGTRSDDGKKETRKAPTGNYGTFTDDLLPRKRT